MITMVDASGYELGGEQQEQDTFMYGGLYATGDCEHQLPCPDRIWI